MTSHIRKYDYAFNIFVIGDDSVGKTCTLLRYIQDDFDPRCPATIVKKNYKFLSFRFYIYRT